MNETSYTYAVARVRANELTLLSAADLEQVIAAPNLAAAEQLLRDRGYADPDGKMEETWRLIEEILPEAGTLNFLIIQNDFHNLKALLKSLFTNSAPEGVFMRPAVYDPNELYSALRDKRFDRLPACMAACAEEAYELLAKTLDGQLADAIIDRQCLETILALAKAAKNDFAFALAELTCGLANVKIALRAEKTGKGRAFLDKALCGIALPEGIPEDILADGAAFEKYCDDALLEHAAAAKAKHFGMEPLIAFYLARQAEVKNVRVVLACKRNDLPAGEIRKRVRLLYV